MSTELNIELFGKDNIDFIRETMCLNLEEIQYAALETDSDLSFWILDNIQTNRLNRKIYE